MKTTEFFEKRLQAPLVNPAFSWGGIDQKHDRVFLRVHRDCLIPTAESPLRALLYKPKWEYGWPGSAERLRHIELLRHGHEGFAVVYWTHVVSGKEKTKGFDRRILLRLGKIRNVGQGVYAEVLGRVPVDDVIGTSANKAEEADIDVEVSRDLPVTDRQTLIKARVGQGKFRDDVLSLWSYRCAVTGCEVQEALRASHIKPWSESNDQERLDKYNGLPLLATLDALFDKHLIAFDARGRMLISKKLSREERSLLLPTGRRLLRLPDKSTARFLKKHAALLR